jgi:alpha-mannosidase
MRESIRKTGRTFANALALMDQYPEFVFAFSQPQLFEFAKEHYPELYERVRQRVAEGRVELVGNAWVEMDTNIPSGESLVRQLLYGRAFYLREFGKASDVYYMPDVFGYSWSLPQIIRRSGGKYFYTSKIMYNDTNRFPHSLFNWQGVDGTRVLAYMQRLNYNGRYNPGTIDQLYKRFDEKCVSENLLMTFGFGDGGGGPDYAMLESGRRLRSFPGLQKTMCGTSADFFAANEGVRDRLPLWNDEMYFEMHRGTQTTQARTKKNNRESELLYRRAEIAASQAMAWAGAGSPNGELLPGYKRLLANQFHDILPGSSIAEVYAEAEGDYARIRRIGEGALSRARQAVLGKVAHEAGDIAVFNSLSWEHRGFVSVECGPGPGAETGAGLWPGPDCVAVVNRATGEISACEQVEKDGERRLCFEAAVPPMGCAVYARADGAGSAASAGERAANGAGLVAGAAESTPPTASVAPIAPVAPTASAAHVAPIARSISHLENDCLSVRFGEDGEIASIYDKEARREVLAAPSNILRLYEDKPARSNAWDIDIEYRNKSWLALPSEAPRLIHNSPLLAVLRLAKAFNRSTIVQDVVLRRGSRRIDFETRVDWQEREKMLKAEFALDVLCGRATYEIQFGAIERSSYGNTSQDRARFEVCAHKWADMSEGGYGAALLNNCKYGYDAVENRLRLTLLRSTIEPDPMADVGEQRFAYSLLPHLGGWQTAGVVNAGYELNAPLEAIVCQGAAGGEASLSLIASGDRNVVIDAVKAAEDGRGLIARVYEATGSRTNACLTAGFAVAGVRECNLMEDDEREIAHSGRAFQFAIKPFEIKTFRLLY